MSDLEDLFDEELPNDKEDLKAELFGSESDDDFVPEVAAAPAPTAPLPVETAADRRKVLQQLATRKRDKGDDEDQPSKKKAKKDSKSKRLRSNAVAADDLPDSAAGLLDDDVGGEPGAAEPLFPGGEENDDNILETDADRAFIDDAGVPEDERYEDDDEDAIRHADEAEEVPEGAEEELELDGVDAVLAQHKRRKEKPTEQEKEAAANDLVSQMETVSEADKKEHARKKPAIHKLRALKDVENFLLQRMNHEAFILHRGLHALAE
eukprot:jgi/Chrzof1/11636/Cz06g03060.t1